MREVTAMRAENGHGDGVDVIVIGAGRNGLTSGCYLTRASLTVLVVEASPSVGGMTSERSVADRGDDGACRQELRDHFTGGSIEQPRSE